MKSKSHAGTYDCECCAQNSKNIKSGEFGRFNHFSSETHWLEHDSTQHVITANWTYKTILIYAHNLIQSNTCQKNIENVLD